MTKPDPRQFAKDAFSENGNTMNRLACEQALRAYGAACYRHAAAQFEYPCTADVIRAKLERLAEEEERG